MLHFRCFFSQKTKKAGGVIIVPSGLKKNNILPKKDDWKLRNLSLVGQGLKTAQKGWLCGH